MRVRPVAAALLIAGASVVPVPAAGAADDCPQLAQLRARVAVTRGAKAVSLLRRAVVGGTCEALDAMYELSRRGQAELAKAYPEVKPEELERAGPDGSRTPWPYAMALWKRGRLDQVVPAAVLEARYLSMGAQLLLWRLYTGVAAGDGISPGDARIVALFQELADDGAPRGQEFLGRIARRGLGRSVDLAEAERWLTPAAPKLVDAKIELGLVRLDQRRFEDALALMDEALRDMPENPAAVGGKGAVLAQAPPPVGDCAKARELLLKAGKELGDEDALFLLALAGAATRRPSGPATPQLTCLGVEFEEGRSYLEAAAQKGHPLARAVLARSAAPRITPEMVAGWERGCAIGAVADCYEYGVHLAREKGDEPGALRCYEKACAGGLQLGCFNAAGLLIKSMETRERGLAMFRTLCERSAAPDLRVRDLACRLSDIVAKNKDLEYPELSRKFAE